MQFRAELLGDYYRGMMADCCYAPYPPYGLTVLYPDLCALAL